MSGQKTRNELVGKMVVGYVRVSTVRQGEYGGSLDDQKEAIRETAERLGLPLFEIFEDVCTGRGVDSFTKREGLKNALRAVAANDGILIVWDWSRLSRHADAHRDITDLVPDPQRIMSIKEGERIDDALSAGRLAHAQSQAERQSALTKAGMAKKRKQGTIFGNPNITSVQSLGAKAISEKAAATARTVMELLNTLPDHERISHDALAKLLNASGSLTGSGLPWDTSRIRNPRKTALAMMKAEQERQKRAVPGFGRFSS